MPKNSFDQQVYDDCHCGKSVVFNSEKEFVKHIIWKDFEVGKNAVTKLIDSKDIFSSASIIAEVHAFLEDIVEFVRNYK